MIDRPTLAAIRFGYGLPLPAGAPTDPQAMLATLRGPDLAARRFPAPGMAEVLPLLQQAAAGRRAAREMGGTRDGFEAAAKAAAAVSDTAGRTLFARAVDSPDGFRERLSAFWSDHFTVRSRNRPELPLPVAMTEEAIRPHLAGRFGDLLVAAALHPAMLVYLDQVASVGPGSVFGKRQGRGVNENLAREVIELHSMGVGAGYSQADVRQMALLLTGLDATAAEGFVFRPKRAEPGAETVLGKTYAGEGLAPIHAVLHDLALRPETAAHIARKLAVHFIADQPDPGVVAAMTAAYTASGGELMQVYAAMLAHPAAWEPVLRKARQPLDFMQAALRGLGVEGAQIMAMRQPVFRKTLLTPMGLMGQRWRNPNGPDGWPEEAGAWITPQGLAARIGWAMTAPGRLIKGMPDPRDFVRRVLGPAADERLIWAAARAESQREGVGLVLASPSFNRR